jgi:hypothetical protein
MYKEWRRKNLVHAAAVVSWLHGVGWLTTTPAAAAGHPLDCRPPWPCVESLQNIETRRVLQVDCNFHKCHYNHFYEHQHCHFWT